MESKTEENVLAKEIVIAVYKKINWDNDVKMLSKAISKKQATQIKKWRIGDAQYSWKSIATLFVNDYPELSKTKYIISENQISGMLLCDAAMLKLKETTEQGWN